MVTCTPALLNPRKVSVLHKQRNGNRLTRTVRNRLYHLVSTDSTGIIFLIKKNSAIAILQAEEVVPPPVADQTPPKDMTYF
jgi:hypothetical protein